MLLSNVKRTLTNYKKQKYLRLIYQICFFIYYLIDLVDYFKINADLTPFSINSLIDLAFCLVFLLA